ncbi:MAG: hypothetical protein EXR58_06210 [Chloroflexi bacterium]|nr:hypothetical protein [Chloroflexota bacterium]
MLQDVRSGHNIVSTVFIETRANKGDGPEAMLPVGETEFVYKIATMSASDEHGKTRIAAGIVRHANLRLGDAVAPLLDAHVLAGGGRFRGIRLSFPWGPSCSQK